MATYSFSQVDVFGSSALAGNPVAVVHDATGLDDEQMAAFARWTNLSETTFLLPPEDPGADYRLRIFTPGEELPFAGHPTLGSAHAWLAAGGVAASPGRVVQECGVGLVELRRDGDALAFRAPGFLRTGPVDEETLGRVVGSPRDRGGTAARRVVDRQRTGLARPRARQRGDGAVAASRVRCAPRELRRDRSDGAGRTRGGGRRLRGACLLPGARHQRGPGHGQPQRRLRACGWAARAGCRRRTSRARAPCSDVTDACRSAPTRPVTSGSVGPAGPSSAAHSSSEFDGPGRVRAVGLA